MYAACFGTVRHGGLLLLVLPLSVVKQLPGLHLTASTALGMKQRL